MRIPLHRAIIAVCLLGFTSITQATAPVTGPIQNPANLHWYLLLEPDTWTASQAKAQALGGNLVTINDAAENAWVISQFLNYGGVNRDLWTGLNDAGVEGVYIWASGEPFSYSNWQLGEPNNGSIYHPTEDYVHIYGGTSQEHRSYWSTGKWNDLRDVSTYATDSGTIRSVAGVVEIVPEPAVSMLLLAGACVLGLWKRVRRDA